MPDDLETPWRASYRRMEDGTKEEYLRVFELLKKFELGLADRVLSALAGVAAGTGIAVMAVNVLSWLWGA